MVTRKKTSTSSSLGSHIPVGKTIPALILRVGDVTGKAGRFFSAKSCCLSWNAERKTPWDRGGLKFFMGKAGSFGQIFLLCLCPCHKIKGEILFHLTAPVKSIFMDLGLEMFKCTKRGRFTGFAVLAFPHRHSSKVVPSQGVILLSSLKPCLPSGLNPSIYGSNPLQSQKSCSSQGSDSRGFMGIDSQELQSRSKAADPDPGSQLLCPVPRGRNSASRTIHSSCSLIFSSFVPQ